MKKILCLLLLLLLSQSVLAQEGELSPDEALPVEPREPVLLRPETALPPGVEPIPLEADHPLYLAGIVLYPVGRLLHLVIVRPLWFIFDHPFSDRQAYCPPNQLSRQESAADSALASRSDESGPAAPAGQQQDLMLAEETND